MSSHQLVEPDRPARPGSRALRWVLVGVQVFIGIGAVYGGIGLMWTGLDMPAEWLESTPFGSWVLPGIFLLLIIAVPMLGAAALETRRSRWAYAASLAAGALQVAWILAQVAIIRRFFFLQPTLAVLGLVVIALAWWTHRGQPLRLGRRLGPPSS